MDEIQVPMSAHDVRLKREEVYPDGGIREEFGGEVPLGASIGREAMIQCSSRCPSQLHWASRLPLPNMRQPSHPSDPPLTLTPLEQFSVDIGRFIRDWMPGVFFGIPFRARHVPLAICLHPRGALGDSVDSYFVVVAVEGEESGEVVFICNAEMIHWVPRCETVLTKFQSQL